ncbi:hypothetical protein FE257_008045 [Aspergillus nanangensis]|uniref:Aminoglycoside phosphotransferase domain-containing protein n=1 Tax=Aspergillus nanangensis TaxID=2582783 RepID=A0AAD4CNP1_ASPNN|nr:hypothetical protein FE257_008045 [Aspergillus nanangensis]
MAPSPSPSQVARILLSWHSLELISCTTLQTLWAGYGHICALTVRATTASAAAHLRTLYGEESDCNSNSHSNSESTSDTYPLILKLISPPSPNTPSDSDSDSDPAEHDEGHLRKLLSYTVEQYFYTTIVPHLDPNLGIAKCLASTRDDTHGNPGAEDLRGLTATIMVDLRVRYPVTPAGKRGVLNAAQVRGALDWMAGFHARAWEVQAWRPEGLRGEGVVLPPLEEIRRRDGEDSGTGTGGGTGKGIWLNGGYTYLATRRKEYAGLAADGDSEWAQALCAPVSAASPGLSSLSVAEMVAESLTPRGRAVESWIHGDVKSENLFTTRAGDEVAFFDFQYVGFGLGVCDLAKLFTCSVPLHMLVDADLHESLPQELAMCDGERRLLEWYRGGLLKEEKKEGSLYEWDTFKRHWETALVDWCRFQASWGFWGNTEWLEARVRSILGDQGWRDWLHQDISSRNA